MLRRDFVKLSSLSVAGTVSPVTAFYPIHTLSPAPNDQLNIGLIGCNGMGFNNLRNHLKQPGVNCLGLCDIDQQLLDARAADVAKDFQQKPTLYQDFRALLDNPDIDAVIIGTPDHWHCLQTVMACESGKDVYVEKPMANSIGEAKVMVDVARHYNRVVQVGQQQRSGAHWKEIVELIQQGGLGKIRMVQAWANFEYGKAKPRVADEPIPQHIDFDMWLGPAPERSFNPSRFHGSWRFQWDYGGGLMTDWGVHLLDMVLWALDINEAPISTVSTGGIYSYMDRQIETPDTQTVLFELPETTIQWTHISGVQMGPYDRNYGIAFQGEMGTLVVNRAGWELMPLHKEGKPVREAIPFQEGIRSNHEQHAKDFLQAIKDRKDPACTVEMGYMAALYAHLGNIANRTRLRLSWDQDKFSFGDKQADQYLTPEYRKPWNFPKI